MRMKQTMQLFCAALLTTSVVPMTMANQLPEGPIRFVVGFAPGSTIDTVARIVAEGLTKRTGATVVVDNRSGANGMIAARNVATSKPDGQTFLISNSSSITVNPLLYDDLSYDPLKDFEAVTTVVSVPFIAAINPLNPATQNINTLEDLVETARKKPAEVTYGSAGIGNLMHLAGAQLAQMSNTDMTHVPYRGAAPMEAALLGNEIYYGFDTLAGVPLMKSGKLKPLAVSAKSRWHELPDVPTVAELGYPDFDISFWVGVFAPAGTPQALVDKFNEEIVALSKDPEIAAKLEQQGKIDTHSPQDFLQKIKDEMQANEALIKRANISIPKK